MTAAIRVDTLCHGYGKNPALVDVSFAIAPATICGLIGPNGAGKTTTLRIVATDLVPRAGRVEILGRDAIADYQELRPRLGFMSDSPDLFEDMTLHSYLEMFGALYGLRKRDLHKAIEVAIELSGLASFRRRRLSNLSKGEAQRVALARTLVHSPEILILDEPADGLDPRGRVELRELLLLLKERGKTILVSSHILVDLEAICDDLVLLDRGRVVYAGSRQELREQGLERERISIELARSDDLPRLRTILASVDGAKIGEGGAGTLDVEVPGGAERAAEILSQLVSEGLRIASFSRRGVSLEDLFLALTGGGGQAPTLLDGAGQSVAQDAGASDHR